MFYKKCKAHQALLRTGCCGPRMVIGGGMLVIPYLHQVQVVDLQSKRVPIELDGKWAAPTSDGQHVRLKAVFYVRVNATVQDISMVYRCLDSETMDDEKRLTQYLAPRLIDTLRHVVGTLSLAELQHDRDQFLTCVLQELEEFMQGLIVDDCAVEYVEQVCRQT